MAWSLDSVNGRVTTTFVADSLISYDFALIPGSDYVDLDMTMRNLTDEKTAGPRPSVSVYPTHVDGHLPPFAEAFETVSAARADATWVVVTSAAGGSYMATTTRDAAFLLNNTRFGCIHAAPSFGDIAPG